MGLSEQLRSGALLVDPSSGPCEICSARKRGHCDACGEKIPVYPNMDGHGYQSPRHTHVHLEPIVDGRMGRRSYFSELCLECYRAAYREAYPDAPLPV